MTISLALSAILAHPVAAEKDKGDKNPRISSWYTQTVLRSDSGMSVTYLWSLKSRFRAETVIRGHRLVTIVNGNTYYVYDALTMKGIAIRRAPAALAEDSRHPRPFGNEARVLIDEGGEKIREEPIGGTRADVYQFTDKNGRRIVWATQDDRQLPIHLEFFDRQSGSTRYKEYIDWINGLAVTNAFFEPEPGIEFKHFELDEYIASTIANDPSVMFPILYQELLHGSAPQ